MVFLRGKVILVGDCCVGKSAISQVLGSEGGMYPKNYSCTIMTDLIIKQIQLTENNDTVELFMHDSSGKAMYFDHCKDTWLNGDMICIVFDITNKDSFGHCKFWFEKAKDMFPPDKKIIGCLIGNKSDLEQRRVITQASAKQLAESLGLKYFECSAKENQNIIDPFKYLASQYVKKYKEKILMVKNMVD